MKQGTKRVRASGSLLDPSHRVFLLPAGYQMVLAGHLWLQVSSMTLIIIKDCNAWCGERLMLGLQIACIYLLICDAQSLQGSMNNAGMAAVIPTATSVMV